MGERDEDKKNVKGEGVGKDSAADKDPESTKSTTKDSEATENTSLRTLMEYEIPFSEIMQDFFDRLQSLTSGYASFDYEFHAYREVTLKRVDVKINDKPVNLLSFLCLEEKSRQTAEKFLKKLTEMIPPAQYEIKLQALIGGKAICRDRIKKLSGLSNDIIAKKILSHGHSGDPQRKKKLLDQQKAKMKSMRQMADVNLPAEAFLEMMKL